MRSRRALLTALGTGVATVTAGCGGDVRRRFDGDPPIDGTCAPAPESWSAAGGDAARTGRTSTEPPPDDASARSVPLGSTDGDRNLAAATPAISNGTAFVSSGSTVVATDPGNGVRWAVDLDDDFDAVPAVGCGVVFAPGLNTLVALDPDRGEVLWRNDDIGAMGQPFRPAVHAFAEETLYVASYGTLAAVDPRTGDARWQRGRADTVAVGTEGVYTTTNGEADPSFHGYDHGGEERFHLSVGKVLGVPTVDGGVVYLVDNTGTIYAVDAHSGVARWTRSSLDNGKLQTGVAVRADTLVVPAGAGGVSYALDTATGEVRWRAETGSVLGRPVVGPDWVAFGRTNVGVSIYDLATGELRTTWERGSHGLGVVRGVTSVDEGLIVRDQAASSLSLLA